MCSTKRLRRSWGNWDQGRTRRRQLRKPTRWQTPWRREERAHQCHHLSDTDAGRLSRGSSQRGPSPWDARRCAESTGGATWGCWPQHPSGLPRGLGTKTRSEAATLSGAKIMWFEIRTLAWPSWVQARISEGLQRNWIYIRPSCLSFPPVKPSLGI